MSISKTLASHNLEVEEVIHLVGKASHLGAGERQNSKVKVGTTKDMSGEIAEQGVYQVGGEIFKHRVLQQVVGETVRKRKDQRVGKK